MDNAIAMAGKIAAYVGVLVCLITGVWRLLGGYFLFGYELSTIFHFGTSLMVFACLAKLHKLTGGT